MEQMEYFLSTLSREFESKISTDPFTCECYSTDIGKYIRRKPLAVALPKSSEEVSILLKLCGDYDVPVTVKGGGTTVGGETVANNSIILDTKSLHKITNIDHRNKTVCVESGMPWIELYDLLKKENLTFKVAPSSATCTVGGTVSLGGMDNHSYVYGSATDQVEEVEVVLADGTVKVCNSEKNREIFRNILYGNGLIGVITKIKMGVKQAEATTNASLYFYRSRRAAFEDYFKLADGCVGNGAMYMEILNQPIIRVEHTEEITGLKGDLTSTMSYENFYSKYAKFIYATRIDHESFPFLLKHSPVSFDFIDIVYPDRNCIQPFFEYSDKLVSKVKTLSKLRLTLAARVMQDARSRPFIPLPSNIEKGDLAFGSYFGSQYLSKYYNSYQREFNEPMIEKTIENRGFLYKYGGHVKQYARRMFGEERWAKVVGIKQKYDPKDILNRGVLF